ncbi:hypothetical protein AB0918_04935 [Streptomyces sp. NPDC006864]|uniref:hypothetical protein n=1 Tax=Streptomyces sp. NPDC006864 TaxID=3154780 RepID=UPI0034521857
MTRIAQRLGKLFANSLFLRHLHGRSPASFAFRAGPLPVLPSPNILCRSCLDLTKNHTEGLFERPGLRIPPAAGRLVRPWASSTTRRAERSGSADFGNSCLAVTV